MKNIVLSMKYLAILGTLLCFLTGCYNNRYANVSKSRLKYKNIVVSKFAVARDGVAEDDPRNVEKHLRTTQAACISLLEDSRLFEDVTNKALPYNADFTLVVQGELTEMRIVGNATRVWLMATAGNSGMTMHIRLVDGRTGSLVAQQQFRGSASGNIADKDLTKMIGQQIAEFIIQTTTQQAGAYTR
ncbi:MAG: hypothetical protein WC539_07070 [Nitrospirota bacterium]